MRLEVRLDRPGLADGKYSVQAKGFLLAALRWADAHGPLPDWTALAYVPLDAAGRGSFRYSGGRAIPPGVTHLHAELIDGDFARREAMLVPLSAKGDSLTPEGGVRFVLMSDLHLSSKPGRIRRALRLARQADGVLIPGDLTNDATPEQFDAFAQIVAEELPGVPVLAVCGNHDYPVRPLPLIRRGVDDWYSMQRWLLDRAEGLGAACAESPCGAYAAKVKGVWIYGLNAASHWRRFVFPEGEQLRWLEKRLREDGPGARIVLCHAPLLDHNPVRIRGREQPYLSRNDRLQEIVDAAGHVIFASGHTHISLSELSGCVETDSDSGNIYINDSSVAPAMLRTAETPADREWADGAVVHLTFSADRTEIAAQCVTSGKWISRGYYRL